MQPGLTQSYLLHQPDEVVEESLFDDLSFVVPVGYGAELHLEAFVRRRDHLSIRGLHGSLEGAGEVGHRAGPVILTEEDLVWVVDQMVVWEGLEELHRL